MKRLLLLLALLLAPPVLAQDPAWIWPTDGTFDWVSVPVRPVTTLLLSKAGGPPATDVKLDWTVSGVDPAAVIFLVKRGIMQPPFWAGRIVAVVDGLTWTDAGALTRTRRGIAVDEFYVVYAIPRTWRGYSSYFGSPVDTEYAAAPRNGSQAILYSSPNGDQFPSLPGCMVIGRDGGKEIRAGTLAPDKKAALIDAWNFPSPGGVEGKTVSFQQLFETNPNTVDHASYYSGAYFEAPAGDCDAPSSTARAVPTPAASKTGNVVTVSWTAPTEDVAGLVASIEVRRTYEGVDGGENYVVVGQVPVSTTEIADDITAVSPGWFCFYELRLIYFDGRESGAGPSSAPVQR